MTDACRSLLGDRVKSAKYIFTYTRHCCRVKKKKVGLVTVVLSRVATQEPYRAQVLLVIVP